MKKIFVMILSVLLAGVLLSGCDGQSAAPEADDNKADTSVEKIHTFGVAIYNVQDTEVLMFKTYLDQYIKQCFSDVTFLYSDTISGEDELLDFYNQCAEAGAEGVLAFVSYNLKEEVELCAEKGMYYIRPNGTSSDADFASVENNPYYLGEIGPGKGLEAEAAREMTMNMVQKEDGNIIVLTGGACSGNEMHRLRAVAILESLEEVYAESFGESCEQLAMVKEVTELSIGDIQVAICPGLIRKEEYASSARELVKSGEYSMLLSTLPVSPISDAINSSDIKYGVIDCFSEDNRIAFTENRLQYVAGKFESEIGPGFAAVYNAVTGNPEVFRVNGKAFRLTQGFWLASSNEEFERKYALASGLAVNAYNNEDLYAVIKLYNPDVTFEDFKKLTESYSYDECLARREK